MKILSILVTFCILAISNSAFAYHHPSQGLGLDCRLSLNIKPVQPHGCAAHVTRSEDQGASGVDINGHHFRSTNRYVDTAACLAVEYTTTLSPRADMTKNQSFDLPAIAMDSAYVSALAVYKNSNGTVDAETNFFGNINYVSYSADETASLLAKSQANSLAQEVFQDVKISYDAATKQLTLQSDGILGQLTSTQAADLSPGSNTGNATFNFPANTLSVNGRSVTASISCRSF